LKKTRRHAAPTCNNNEGEEVTRSNCSTNPLELAERKESVGVDNEHHTDDDVGIVYLGQNGH